MRGEQRLLLTNEELRRQAVEALLLSAYRGLAESIIGLPIFIHPMEHLKQLQSSHYVIAIKAIKHGQQALTEYKYTLTVNSGHLQFSPSTLTQYQCFGMRKT